MNLRQEFTGGARGMAHGSDLDRWAAAEFGGRLDELVMAAEAVACAVPGARGVIDALPTVPSASRFEREEARSAVAEGEPPMTSVLRERAERVGQSLFRGRVLANFDYACAFCGLRSRMPDRNSFLLLASHIRPWAESTGHQRLDLRNGLSLCAIHDRAFDWGFVTVDADYRVVVSPHAREHYEPEARVQQEIGDLHGQEIRHPEKHFTWPDAGHLAFHREMVFERKFLY